MPPLLNVDTVDQTIADASLIKQIECPSVAKPSYNTKFSLSFDGVSLGDSSLIYLGTTVIPHTLGYLNYNFTALGSNYSADFAEKAGLAGSYASSKRVLGYNYFTKTGAECNTRSEKECVGKDQYMYIRNYPVLTKDFQAKGNLSFALFNDIIDLNPIPLIKSMVTPGVSEQCKMSPERSVGSAIDGPKRFANKEAFVRHYNSCIPNCPAKPTVEERENCLKDCLRGHWKDRKCIPIMSPETQVETFHAAELNHTAQRTQRRPLFACLVVALVCLCMCMCMAVSVNIKKL
jgi:hypothetical protein